MSWFASKFFFGTEFDQEIRSEVLWSGNLNYNTPTDTTYSDKFRVVIDTSFTIKGWLFPEQKDTVGTIYEVNNNTFLLLLSLKLSAYLHKGMINWIYQLSFDYRCKEK